MHVETYDLPELVLLNVLVRMASSMYVTFPITVRILHKEQWNASIITLGFHDVNVNEFCWPNSHEGVAVPSEM